MSQRTKKIFTKKLSIFIGVILGLAICFIGASFLIDKSYKTENLTEEDVEFLLISGKKNFKLDDKFTFEFKYQPKNTVRKMTASVVNLFGDKYKDIKVKAVVLNLDGQIVGEFEPQIVYLGDGEFAINLNDLRYNHMFRPGKYILRFEVEDGGKIFIENEDFTLGVLSINTNKSIYLPGEEAYLQLASLDERGNTLCDSNLELIITDSRNRSSLVEIKKSGNCSYNNVVLKPDYYTYYKVGPTGVYKMKLKNLDNGFEIEDSFEVRESVPFDIERIGPTRIYPLADYEMIIKIKTNQDFQGKVTEIVPMLFVITPIDGLKPEQKSIGGNYTKTITWQVDWEKGNTYELKYRFDAPDVSPYLYLLGPFKIGDFQETRKWQVASDNVTGDLAPTGDGTDDSANFSNGTNACNATDCWDELSESSGAECGSQSDGDTSYITSSTAGATQTFTVDISGIPDGSTITDIQITVCAKKLAGGGSFQTRRCVDGACTSYGTDTAAGAAYAESVQTHSGLSISKTSGTVIEVGIDHQSNGKAHNYSRIDAVITYDPPANTIISGTCYDSDQVSHCADGQTVNVAINGSLDGDDDATTSGGSWSITRQPQMAQWDTVTAFLQDPTNVASRAVGFAVEDSTNNVTGMVLYESHLTIGSADNITASNSDLDDYDNSVSTDADIFFDVDTNNDLEVCDAIGSPGCEDFELFVLEGNTYRPDSGNSGNVDAHDIEIDGTFSLDGNIASVSGSWHDDGVFTEGTSTVVFTASQSVSELVSVSANATDTDFYNVKFGDSAEAGLASWDLYINLDANADLTIDAGTVDNSNGNYNVNIGNDLLISSGGAYVKNGGTVTFDGTTGPYTWTDNKSPPSNMGDVSINGTTLTIALGSDVKALTVNIATGQTLDLGDSGYKLTISDGGTNPITATGTLDTGADSEVEFIASASPAPYINTISYHDLTLASAGTTFYSNGDTTVSGSFNVQEGTFNAQDDTWTLRSTGTPFTVEGTFVAGTSTFNYAGNGATTIASTSETDMGSYYNLQVGNDSNLGSANTYSLEGTTTVTNTLTIGPDTGNTQTFDVSASNHSLLVEGNFTAQAQASVSARSGTVTFGGSTQQTTYSNAGSVEFYNLTINKTSGTDANDDFNLSSVLIVRNTLTITDGELVQGAQNVTVEGSTAVSIAAAGEWNNISTGDLTLGGTFANAGIATFNTNNSGCTNVSDDIVITTTDGATQRTWSGAGTFRFHNVNVSYQTGTIRLTVYDGTNGGNNGANWFFESCAPIGGGGPIIIKGSTIIKGGVRLR